MANPTRIKVLVGSDPQKSVRLQPHRKDPSLVVVKSPHPEGFASLCGIAGLSPADVQTGETFQGTGYFITTLTRDNAAKIFGPIAKVISKDPDLDTEQADHALAEYDDSEGDDTDD